MARGTPVALSIAGSDSGGGAGIQADLKAFARCGVHGTCAITAITAQNTAGVEAVHALPPEIVLAQVRAVVRDLGVDAVKVGMLGTEQVMLAVARALDELPPCTPVVVDPVMVAESGARLIDEEAEHALLAEILPRASVLTPNLPEARVLADLGDAGTAADDEALHAGEARTGKSGPEQQAAKGRRHVRVGWREEGRHTERNDPPSRARADTPFKSDTHDYEAVQTHDEAVQLARALLGLGPRAVVLTGGHRARASDLFADADDGIVEIAGERHPDGAAHGSGCTHSSVLAAQLALGRTPLEAARIARALAGEAVAQGLRDLGAGAGPVDVLGLAELRAGLGNTPASLAHGRAGVP